MHPENKVYPYLLRGVPILCPNQVWSTEIVCSQMTKADMFTARVRGNHVADLDFGICYDHPVDQEFDQLPLLFECGTVQSGPDTCTEVIDGDGEPRDLFMHRFIHKSQSFLAQRL